MFSEFDGGLRLGVVSRLLSRWVLAPPPPASACAVDWVAGASLMIRGDVLRAVGLLDEGYFLYYEEVDYCLKAARAGFRCWYVPESRVVHLVGRSTGVTNPEEPRRLPAYWFESRRRYFVQNHGALYCAAADLLWIVGFLLWRLRRPLQGKPDLDPPRLLADFLHHSVPIGGTSRVKGAPRV